MLIKKCPPQSIFSSHFVGIFCCFFTQNGSMTHETLNKIIFVECFVTLIGHLQTAARFHSPRMSLYEPDSFV